MDEERIEEEAEEEEEEEEAEAVFSDMEEELTVRMEGTMVECLLVEEGRTGSSSSTS